MAVIYGQTVSVDLTKSTDLTACFKIYVDGELRDQSLFISTRHRDWRVVARASIFNAEGQKRELQLLVRGTGIILQNFEWILSFEGRRLNPDTGKL